MTVPEDFINEDIEITIRKITGSEIKENLENQISMRSD